MMKYATAVRERVRLIPRGETFTTDTLYRIGRVVKPQCDPIAPSAERASLRCVAQRLRDNEGLLFLRTPGFYRWPLTDRKPYKQSPAITGEELLLSIAPNANVVNKLSTPREGRGEVPMLQSTSTPPTAFAAAFAKAEADKTAPRNRSEKLEGKAGFYDGKVIEKSELEAALEHAEPLSPNCPVLTPAILKDRLKRSAKGQFSEDFTVIALMAMYILSEHPWEKNRTLDQAKLAQYKSFMLSKAWNLDGTPIKFNDLGELHNGRHRLTACANSGASFATAFRFGVAKDTYKTEDTGRSWRAKDVFTLAGWKYAAAVPHIIRAVVYYNEGDFKSRDTSASNALRLIQGRQLGQRKLEKVAEQGKAIASQFNSKKRKPNERYRIASQYFSQAHYIAREINESDADKWFAKWATDPSKIQTEAAKMMNAAPGQGHDTICRAIPILAWNLFRTNPKADIDEIRQALHWAVDYPSPVAED